MFLLSLLAAATWATTSIAIVLFPGPHSISLDADGNPYVDSSPAAGGDAIRHYAVDYDQMRPTVVYNCHWLIALCANARAYLGAGNNGPVEFHYDRNEYRGAARRATICPTGWANTNCINGPQLDWYTSRDRGATRYPPIKYCDKDAKRYGYTKPGEVDENGEPKKFAAGVISSCDEFPPASWIEGGVQGGTGAKAICAPFAQGKGNGNPWPTEQTWQGNVFRKIGLWLSSITPTDRLSSENEGAMFSIYTIHFKMVDERNTASALWIEANGNKRYCAGPKTESCSPSKTDAEYDIAHDVNDAMLDLEASLNPPPGTPVGKRGLNETISYRSAAERVPLAAMVMAAS